MATALSIGLQPYGTLFAVVIALAFGAARGRLQRLPRHQGRHRPLRCHAGYDERHPRRAPHLHKQQPISGTDDAFTWWGGGSIGFVPVPLVITLLLLGALAFFLKRTRAGRNFYAIGGNRDAAYLAGIAVDRHCSSPTR